MPVEFESNVRSYCLSSPNVFDAIEETFLFSAKNRYYIDFLSECGSLNCRYNHSNLKGVLFSYIRSQRIAASLDEIFSKCTLQPHGLKLHIPIFGFRGNRYKNYFKQASSHLQFIFATKQTQRKIPTCSFSTEYDVSRSKVTENCMRDVNVTEKTAFEVDSGASLIVTLFAKRETEETITCKADSLVYPLYEISTFSFNNQQSIVGRKDLCIIR